MKILIAGGTGFLGKHVVKKLEKLGIPCVPASRSLGVDFRDLEATDRFFAAHKFDYVINCAASVGGIFYGLDKPGEIYLDNMQMTTNLLEVSRRYGIARFINPISNCSYPGHLTKDFREEDWWNGELHESVRAYGFVKKASWIQAWSYNKQYGMDSIHLILPNMYGPSDHFDEKRSHALGALIKKICDAKIKNLPKVIVWGTGSPIREWLYVEDAAEILVKAVALEKMIDPINIGIDKGISIRDLAALIQEIVGYQGELAYDITKPDGAPYKTMNNEKMVKVFEGWTPPTNIRTGIKNTIEYYLNHVAK